MRREIIPERVCAAEWRLVDSRTGEVYARAEPQGDGWVGTMSGQVLDGQVNFLTAWAEEPVTALVNAVQVNVGLAREAVEALEGMEADIDLVVDGVDSGGEYTMALENVEVEPVTRGEVMVATVLLALALATLGRAA